MTYLGAIMDAPADPPDKGGRWQWKEIIDEDHLLLAFCGCRVSVFGV